MFMDRGFRSVDVIGGYGSAYLNELVRVEEVGRVVVPHQAVGGLSDSGGNKGKPCEKRSRMHNDEGKKGRISRVLNRTETSTMTFKARIADFLYTNAQSAGQLS
jgi:hypothetical protein